MALKMYSWVGKYPWRVLFATLILSILTSSGAVHFKNNFSYRVWFEETSPLLATFDAFEEKFGNDDTVVLLVHSPSGVFDLSTVKLVQEITGRLWASKAIQRVDSFVNFNWSQSANDEILIEPIVPIDRKITQEFLDKRAQWLKNDPVLPGYLVSKDQKSAVIQASLKPTFKTSPKYDLIVAEARSILKDFENRGDHVIYLAGTAPMSDAFRESAMDDAKIVFPLLMILIALVFYYLYRSILAIVFPALVIGLSSLIGFGVGGFFGFTLNNMTAILPQIMITVGIADTIHLMTGFLRNLKILKNSAEAMTVALKEEIGPIFLTSVTTAIGFGSLCTSKIVPISQLGLLAAVGVIGAFVVTIGVVAPLLVFFGRYFKSDDIQGAKILPMSFVKGYILFLSRWKVQVIVASVVLFVAGFWISNHNEVNSDPREYFAEHVPVRKAMDFGMKSFDNGFPIVEMIFDSGEIDGIKDPEFLRKLEKLESWLLEKPYVSKTFSMLSVLKQLNKTLHNDDPAEYKIPETKQMVAQQMFLYTMGLPEGTDLSNRMTTDYRYIRYNFNWGVKGSKPSLIAMDGIEKKARDLGLNGHITGKTSLYLRMNDLIVPTFFKSMGGALLFIALILSWALKSGKLGLLSLVPNVLPVVFGGAVLTLVGQFFDIGTAMVASVCLGIAIDDTIHVLFTFRDKVKGGASAQDALIYVLAYKAPALFFTTCTLVLGFSSFIMASFSPNLTFGLLSAFVLVVAFVIDVVFLPAILLVGEKPS